jgi:hypothetical protein
MTRTPAEILHYLITHAEYEEPISLTPLRLESPEPLTPEDVTEIHRLVQYVPALLVNVSGLEWYTEEQYSFYKHILPLIDLHWISCAGYDHMSLTKRRENDSCIGLVLHQKVVDGCCKTGRFLRFWIGQNPNEAKQHERETA